MYMVHGKAYPIIFSGSWSEWNECTRTCGGGTQEKNRTCFGPYFGGLPCDGDEIKTQACNTQPCPGIVQRFPAVCRLE